MKGVFFAITFILISSPIFSQFISPFTLNIGGFTASQNGYNLTISTGESISITNFGTQGAYSVNSGFLQNFTPIVTGINDVTYLKDNEFNIFPNPTTGLSRLIFSKPISGQLQYQVLDVNSKIIYNSPINLNGNILINNIDLTSYSYGVYYIRIIIKNLNGKLIFGVVKLIKI